MNAEQIAVLRERWVLLHRLCEEYALVNDDAQVAKYRREQRALDAAIAALTPQPPAAVVELFIAECYANGRDGSWEVGDAKTRNRIALCFSKADAERVRDALTTPTPAAVPDAVRALRRFVGDAEQVDLGGGDAVVTTCESLEMAKTALSAAPDCAWVLVRKEAIDWLNGESEFECPPDRYFRGEPPKYWWRSVFREKAGLDQQDGQL